MAENHTPTRSELKKADNQAGQAVAAFSQALDIAFEAEMYCIVGALRKNRELTHGLCGMLKADTIQALMDGRLRAEASYPAAAADRGERQVVRLRSATKRFEQLKTQPAVVLRLLRTYCPSNYQKARAQRLACNLLACCCCPCLFNIIRI